MQSKLFLEKLNALISCDPSNCVKSGCPLYYEEIKKCDADRFIKMAVAVFQEKLQNVDTYDPYYTE